MMSFRLSDAFINKPTPRLPDHLWAVISDPHLNPEKIVIVNFTTWMEGEDASCILNKGDHSFLKHKTYVNYDGAKVVSGSKLDELKSNGLIIEQPPLAKSILSRIHQGAGKTLQLSLEVRKILESQNLV